MIDQLENVGKNCNHPLYLQLPVLDLDLKNVMELIILQISERSKGPRLINALINVGNKF
jgi:hypothetical protein